MPPLSPATLNAIPNRRTVTDAIKAALVAGTGKPVGIMRAPFKSNDVELVEDPPYLVLYPLPGGGTEGAFFSAPDEITSWVYQISSIAVRDDQCQWMADLARQVILGRSATGTFVIPVTLTGMTIMSREPASPPGGMIREDGIYTLSDSYLIRVCLS